MKVGLGDDLAIQKVLAEAISWSNANLYFAASEYGTNNETDLLVAADILRGLEHLGYTIERIEKST